MCKVERLFYSVSAIASKIGVFQNNIKQKIEGGRNVQNTDNPYHIDIYIIILVSCQLLSAIRMHYNALKYTVVKHQYIMKLI